MNLIQEKRLVQCTKTNTIYIMEIETDVSEDFYVEIKFTNVEKKNQFFWKSFNLLNETVQSCLEKNDFIHYELFQEIHLHY